MILMTSLENLSEQKKTSPVISFFRYNLVAMLATTIDFLTLIFLTELVGIWYLSSTTIAAITGAFTAFLLSRYWVFVSLESKIHHQMLRYFLVAAGSVALNSLGVYTLTEFGEIQYLISKGITAIVVGIGYNYTLGRYFVFN